MPTAPLVDIESKDRGERELSEAVFGVKPNRQLIYEAVRHFLASRRRGTHATKTRGEVAGSGRKPWRQKGTGRARVGSVRTPIWRGGGTVFGPEPRDYSFKLPGKVQRGALRSALSLRATQGALTVVKELGLESPSTKRLKEQLDGLGLLDMTRRVLLVDVKPSRELVLSARNLPYLDVVSVASLHAYQVLAAKQLVFSEEAVSQLEQRLGA